MALSHFTAEPVFAGRNKLTKLHYNTLGGFIHADASKSQ